MRLAKPERYLALPPELAVLELTHLDMETMSNQTLRIIDANLNRIGEGLRVLEEIARLLLDDAALSQQLKDIRHEMVKVDLSLEQQFLQARNSEGDVGINLEVSGEEKYKEIPETVVANARRVQEALRVMEELAKNPGVPLESDKFKWARFNLYTIEKELFSKLMRRGKAQSE
ncbi:Thiamine-phosphate synthase [subsurface metagenome]